MASKIVIGKSKWAKVLESQLDIGKYSKDHGGEWSVDLIIDDDSSHTKEGLIADGIHASKFRENDDGETYLRLRRKRLKQNGTVENEAPYVIDKDGKPFDQEIGNGSLIRVHFDFFGKGNMQGLELNDVQVLEHVEYSGAVDNRGKLGAYSEGE